MVLSSVTYAKAEQEKKDNDKSPIGCHSVGYEYYMKSLIVKPEDASGRQSMYFFYNQLAEPVRLYHMRYNDSPYSMRLNTRIKGQQWGVLATGEKEIHYVCAVDDKSSVYGRIVDCEKSIKVCEYPKVKFGMNNTGNYWIIDSTTKNGAVHAVVRYGIIPAY